MSGPAKAGWKEGFIFNHIQIGLDKEDDALLIRVKKDQYVAQTVLL